MNTIWILAISLGCNGWGCGQHRTIEYPSEAACYKAIEKMQLINAAKLVGGESQNQAVAICYPKYAPHDAKK